ncbi:uncharacterized protein LOC131939280 [Physella acuta]|uniref:uncharacterized protein LOC131939280 n=1 Tax=Physella acuta TaxID=109671 RepID=UPI0027DB7AFE|nr:uncharacterized protein LOC131939280 [Physella acuta]
MSTTNKPTKRVECINSSNSCVCIENQNLNFSANTLTGNTNEADVTLPFVLGLILATSIVINIVMGIVVCWVVARYKRLNREKMKPVSFVDSFIFDLNHTPDPCQPNTRANEDTAGQVPLRGQQDTIAYNGTTELTYSYIDQVQTQMMESSDYDDVDVSALPGGQVKVKSDDPVKSAPPSQDCSDPHSTYHHLWAQNGQLNMVDTVYGDSSTCSVDSEGDSPV